MAMRTRTAAFCFQDYGTHKNNEQSTTARPLIPEEASMEFYPLYLLIVLLLGAAGVHG